MCSRIEQPNMFACQQRQLAQQSCWTHSHARLVERRTMSWPLVFKCCNLRETPVPVYHHTNIRQSSSCSLQIVIIQSSNGPIVRTVLISGGLCCSFTLPHYSSCYTYCSKKMWIILYCSSNLYVLFSKTRPVTFISTGLIIGT